MSLGMSDRRLERDELLQGQTFFDKNCESKSLAGSCRRSQLKSSKGCSRCKVIANHRILPNSPRARVMGSGYLRLLQVYQPLPRYVCVAP